MYYHLLYQWKVVASFQNNLEIILFCILGKSCWRLLKEEDKDLSRKVSAPFDVALKIIRKIQFCHERLSQVHLSTYKYHLSEYLVVHINTFVRYWCCPHWWKVFFKGTWNILIFWNEFWFSRSSSNIL